MTVEHNKKLHSIAATLKYGLSSADSPKKIRTVYIIFSCICIALLIVAITMLSIEQQAEPSDWATFAWAIVACLIAFLGLPLIWLVIVIKNEKRYNEIDRWVEDAIQLESYVSKIDIKYWYGMQLIKICVSFNIGGIEYKRYSERADGARPKGYYPYLLNFADKHIQILYSPKYDEVMILKEPKH